MSPASTRLLPLTSTGAAADLVSVSVEIVEVGVEVVDDHLRAVLGEQLGRRPADAGGRAGDDDGFHGDLNDLPDDYRMRCSVMLVLFSAADGRDSRLRFRQPFEPMTPGIVSLAAGRTAARM